MPVGEPDIELRLAGVIQHASVHTSTVTGIISNGSSTGSSTATLYEKHAVNFLVFVKLAAIRRSLRVFESSGNLRPLPRSQRAGAHFWSSKPEERKQP